MLAALNTLSHIQTPMTCRIACSQSFKPFKLTRTSNAASMVILVILVIWVGCFDNDCFFLEGFSRLQRFFETSDLDAIAQAMSGHDGISKARLYHTRKPQCEKPHIEPKSKKSKKSNVNSECCKTVFNLGQLRQDKALTTYDMVQCHVIKSSLLD